MNKIKNLKQKLSAMAMVAALSIGAAVPCFASVSDPYAETTTKITEEASKMISSGNALVIATISAGLVIFGAFTLFRLGKRGINAAVSGR